MPNYREGRNLIPPHMWEGVEAYLDTGRPVGDFLTAVFENNLVEAYGRADATNQRCMKDWASFLYNHAPAYPIRSWGSKEIVKAWIAAGGLSGIVAAAAQTEAAKEVRTNE